MATKSKKKQNIFAAYFTPFGLRQICDLIMLAGAITIFVGLFTVEMVTIVGLSLYMVGTLVAIYRATSVLTNKNANKRAPEYRNAKVNIVLMSIVLVFAVLALIAIFMGW